MDRYEGHHTALTINLHGGLYLAIMMDRYERLHPALTIALHKRPLHTHYNGPS
jgi:hypothetical protein